MDSTILNNRYRLGELLGAGGMALVYRAQDTLLDRPVAIKMLREPYASDPNFRERFLNEARTAARLDHPNIVHIYDVSAHQPDAQQEQPYIVMEVVNGQDLKTLIRQQAPLRLPQALEFARQICAAVGVAHRAGLVHCDLKPQNVLVTQGGQIKITDFGIARAFQKDSDDANAERVIWGSPHYIAPEQVQGQAPTPASDVYSIGIILYEMLTGVPPFHAEDPNELVLKHLREEPTPMTSFNPRVPPRLEWLVRKVLAKEPAARYRNAEQFGMAIEAYRQSADEGTTPLQAVAAPTGAPLNRERIAAPGSPEATPLNPTPAQSVTPPMAPPLPPRPQPQSAPAAPSTIQETAESDQPDWLLWLLWIVAAAAVLGLIPLMWRVYRTYTTPAVLTAPAIATITPTVEATTQIVTVPNLINLSASEAQRLLQSYNLSLAVTAERETTEALPGTILEQDPRAGTRIPSGSVVNITVAQGAAFLLPDLVGYQHEVISRDIEAQGLLIVTEETWSTEPRGKILAQQPAPNTQIRAGATITLTLSGGVEQPIPLQVNLNNLIILEEARVPQTTMRPGNTLPVTLRWRALQPTGQRYTVFVHLLSPEMNLVTQHDSEPLNGLSPTNSWLTGEIIVDPHQLTIPAGTPAGTYQIRVGLYAENARLQVIDPGAAQVIDNSILITQLEISP
ncbi:MAG: Stk1 family PASTA domain-containing Ser/Thr kinase [Anaerolineae bacterium]|nr:Stk1 family PASTA domain-containing Ser/Thr kinase [Anaerolineae bacterium]